MLYKTLPPGSPDWTEASEGRSYRRVRRAVNRVLTITAVFSLLSCVTYNISQMPTTKEDRETVPTFNAYSAYVVPSRVMLISGPRGNIGQGFGPMVESATNKVLHSLGGVQVVSRRYLPAIAGEIRLQQGGFTDGQVMIAPGFFAGASHIVVAALTGLTVEQDFSYGSDKMPAHWDTIVQASVDFKVIDIRTSVEIYGDAISGSYRKSSVNRLDDRSAAALVPEALDSIFEDVRPELQGAFPVTTAIIAMKGGGKIAMIPAGKTEKMRKGTQFTIFKTFFEQTALGRQAVRQPVGTLKIFHVDASSSWGAISSAEGEAIKVGMEVVSIPEGVSIFSKIARWFNRNVTVLRQ